MAAALRRNLPFNLQPHPEHFPLQLRHKNPRYHQQHRLSICNQNNNAKPKHTQKKNPIRMAISIIQPFYTANDYCLGRIRHLNRSFMRSLNLFFKQMHGWKILITAFD